MALPGARPGLVFRYEYLWKRQQLAGRNAGEKDRPACVVLAISGPAGNQRVVIAPITTQAPATGVPALAIPPAIVRHLGLGGDRASWIILNEVNLDVWPSPDMRPIPDRPEHFQYGVLPLRMVNAIRETILAALAARRLASVQRDNEAPLPGTTIED